MDKPERLARLVDKITEVLINESNVTLFFKEVEKHKNTKSLYNSKVFKKTSFRALLDSVERKDNDARLSRSKLKFLHNSLRAVLKNKEGDSTWI